MATHNPFADDDVKGEIWERGYLDGFAAPDSDHFLPFAPDLLDVYQQGVTEGRADRKAPPPGNEGSAWEALEDIGEHVIIHALGLALEKVGVAAGGLISLVLTVVTIPGDVQLQPLEPDFSESIDQDDSTYVAFCPSTDHTAALQGATSDGYWLGPERTEFKDAANDVIQHRNSAAAVLHTEAVVVRCSVREQTCGPVWPITQ